MSPARAIGTRGATAVAVLALLLVCAAPESRGALTEPLNLTTGRVGLRFNTAGRDKLVFRGTVTFTQAVMLANQTVTFDFGGITGSVNLDEAERSPKGEPKVSFKIKGHKKGDLVPAGTIASVSVAAVGSFGPQFAPQGVLTLNTTTPKPFLLGFLEVTLSVGPEEFAAQAVPGTWRAKLDASGKFTLARPSRTTPVLALASSQADPGTLLAITGDTFSAKNLYHVSFIDSVGRVIPVQATTVTPASLFVPVPPFLDGDTVQFSQGTVRVSVAAEKGSRLTVLGSVDGFTINDLPATGVPPGDITLAFLQQLEMLAGQAVANWEKMEEFSGDGVDAATLRAELLGLQKHLQDVRAQFQQVRDGVVSEISMGQLGGHAIQVDLDALAQMDRLYLAFFVNADFAMASSLLAAASVPDPVQAVADEFAAFLQSDLPREIREFSNRFNTAGNAIIGVATLTAVILTGSVTVPIAASALAAAALWNATTWIPAAYTAALEGGTRLLIQGDVGGFPETTALLSDRLAERATGALTDRILIAVTGDEALVALGKSVASVTSALPTTAAGPVRGGEKQSAVISVARFNGSYSGGFSGTAVIEDPDFGPIVQPVSGSVAFTITNGKLSVTVPGNGKGTVFGSGDSSFTSGGGAGSFGGLSVKVTFDGQFTAVNGLSTGAGGWSAGFKDGSASGTWSAAR